METLRVELARAKEQARSCNAAALNVAKELRAEQATHCESKERMAKMVVEVKDAADRYQLLEKESRAKATDLEKAMVAAKEACSKIRATKGELPFLLQISSLGSPSCCGLSSEIRSMLLLINYGVRRTPMWIWRQVLLRRPSTSKIKKIAKWKAALVTVSCSSPSAIVE